MLGLGLIVLKNWPLLVLLWQLRQPLLGAPPDYRPSLPTDKPSIAVLPFTVLSEDPRLEYFGDGLMEDLSTDLSKLSGLVVTWFASTHLYKGKVVTAQDVSKKLGVRYIVQGSARTVGERIVISAQLRDGTTGVQVWAERYERPQYDLFTVQEDVRRKILLHLGLKLIPQEEERLQHLYTPSLEAYNAVAHGMELFFRGVTPSDNAKEQQFYERAIALDQNYALAYAMLGFARWRQWTAQPVPNPQLLDHVFALAQQALALDDSLVHGHELLGIVYLYRDRSYEQALAEIKRAISLSPSWFSAYFLLEVTLNAMGRPEETIALEEKMLHLSPKAHLANLYVVGNAYRMMHRYEEAKTRYRKILIAVPYHPFGHLGLAAIYGELGREEEAQAEAAAVLQVIPQLSLEALMQRIPYQDPAESGRHVAALRKAGLK